MNGNDENFLGQWVYVYICFGFDHIVGQESTVSGYALSGSMVCLGIAY